MTEKGLSILEQNFLIQNPPEGIIDLEYETVMEKNKTKVVKICI